MAVTFIQAPPTYAGAFAPIELIVGGDANESSATIYVMLVEGSGMEAATPAGQVVTIRRTLNAATQQTTINLEYLARLLFVKDAEQMTMPSGQPVGNPPELVGQLRISTTKAGTATAAAKVVTVFSSLETSITPDGNPPIIGRLLNGQPLTYYAGYPMPIAVRKCTTDAAEVVAVKYLMRGVPVAEWTMAQPVTMLPTPSSGIDAIRITIDGNGGDYKIIEGCVPEAPYYVRYLNTGGGWSYVMFTEWLRTVGVRDVNNVEAYTQSLATMRETVAVEPYEVVEVGKELISKSEQRRLAGIMRSPLIQWWEAGPDRWRNIIINGDMTISEDVNSGLGAVRFSFLQPPVTVQF